MVGITTIMRHEAQLRQASAQISQARSIIDEAQKACAQAAENLVANWEGDAANAFAAEQANYKTWIQRMIEIINEVVNVINTVNDAYTKLDNTMKNIIGK